MLSNKSYMHDKSYLFSEIDPSFMSKINYIFAGNSSSQYFVNQKPDRSYNYNQNIIYWCDKIKNITAYSVGMKFAQHYVKGSYVNGKILIEPKMVKNSLNAHIKKKNYFINIILNNPKDILFLFTFYNIIVISGLFLNFLKNKKLAKK
jgi:hypothetical protein